jgi:type II secretory pathway component PulF
MPQFRYHARKSDGKMIDGVITCNDRGSAILQVESQGGVPIKIEPVSASGAAGSSTSAPNLIRELRQAARLAFVFSEIDLRDDRRWFWCGDCSGARIGKGEPNFR